jgi:hypothetical protein
MLAYPLGRHICVRRCVLHQAQALAADNLQALASSSSYAVSCSCCCRCLQGLLTLEAPTKGGLSRHACLEAASRSCEKSRSGGRPQPLRAVPFLARLGCGLLATWTTASSCWRLLPVSIQRSCASACARCVHHCGRCCAGSHLPEWGGWPMVAGTLGTQVMHKVVLRFYCKLADTFSADATIEQQMPFRWLAARGMSAPASC